MSADSDWLPLGIEILHLSGQQQMKFGLFGLKPVGTEGEEDGRRFEKVTAMKDLLCIVHPLIRPGVGVDTFRFPLVTSSHESLAFCGRPTWQLGRPPQTHSALELHHPP